MSWLSKTIRKVTKQIDRSLDDAGIDNPDIRQGIVIAGGAALGGIAGAQAGVAVYGATGVGSVAGVGLGTLGSAVGTLAGAAIAGSGLTPSFDPTAPEKAGFPLPTNFPLAAATGELKSGLAKKRKRAQTRFTGGLEGGDFLAPKLTTA